MFMVRNLCQEFKEFAFKGNMLDLAVAVVIGTAFGAVVNSLVKNIIMPAVSYIQPGDVGYRAWHLGRIEIGAFMGELITFLIIAATVFLLIVKIVGALMKRATAPPPAAAPLTKECPFCLMVIPVKAIKCGHCTADLTPAAGAARP
jgi:large conductance mechanosensitive channel